MNMPDKNIDQLFRSKLEGFEVEPSANVWSGIAYALRKNKRKNYTTWLSVAASVVILITAAILFMPGKPAKNNAGDNKIVKGNAPDRLLNQVEEESIINRNTGNDVIKTDIQVAVTPHAKPQPQAVKTTMPSQVVNDRVKTDAAVIVNQPEQVVASVEPKPLQQAVVPDIDVAVKTVGTTTADENSSPVTLAANSDVQEQPKKHKIRGLGSLINMVVASVDKRKDKIIEFADNDEGDSVTGINLGFIKVKKDK